MGRSLAYLSRGCKLPGVDQGEQRLPKGFEQPNPQRQITTFTVIETLVLLAISLQAGTFLSSCIQGTEFELPTFACVLFVGVVLRNGL